MSIFTTVAGMFTGDGNAVAKPIEAVGDAFDKLFTSDKEKLAAQIVLKKLEQHPAEWQVALNKIELQSTSNFKSGWRPFIGWTCGLSLAIYYIPQFMLASYLWVKFSLAANGLQPYPIADISGLTELIFGMLGLSAMRTIEKFGRISR